MVLPILNALSDPTRLAAVAMLSDGEERCVCQMMRELGATQSRMSRHMQILRQVGLVRDRRDAQWVRYRLEPDMAPGTRAIVDAVLAAHRKEEAA